jgi:hypothetical protein
MAVTTSRLLLLPGEIRNAIYAYALTAKSGVICVVRNHASNNFKDENRCGRLQSHDRALLQSREDIAPNESSYEANQLKFVNRQLYSETHNLTLRYNDLTVSTADHFSHLIESLPDSNYASLRIVTLSKSIFSNLEKTSQERINSRWVEAIFEFCRRAPHVLVRDPGPRYPMDEVLLIRAGD